MSALLPIDSVVAADPVVAPERMEEFAAAADRIGSDGPATTQAVSDTQTVEQTVSHGSIGISSWSTWVDSFGYLNIVGDVLNRTSDRNAGVVHARLLDARGQQLGPTETIDPYSWPIAAGARSPFAYYEPAPSGFDHAELTFDAATWTAGPMHGALRPVLASARTDVGGDRHYDGWLHNMSSFAISEWIVSVGLYDSAGRLLNAWHDYRDQTLQPGASASFKIVIPDHYSGASVHLFQAQGISADFSQLAVSWDNYFDDVGGSAFRNDIIWLGESGITGGCAAGRFCPTSLLDRGQMAAFLDRGFGLPPTSTDFFDDDEDSMFEASINRLAAAGITGGCGTRLFCPTSNLTRGEMAAFIDRSLSLPATSTDYFDDDEDSMFEASINRLAAAGITGGCAKDRFCPDAFLTRGEMAAFMRRALS